MPSFADLKDIAPWVAMIFSIAALWISILNYRRDSAVLKATSRYLRDRESFHASLRVDIVNAGRRPIILASWAGVETKRGRFGRRVVNDWFGTNFEPKGGLVLGERQAHSFQLEADEILDMLPDGEMIEFHDMWIVDTLGHRHMVKDAVENIEKLRKWKAQQSPQVQASK